MIFWDASAVVPLLVKQASTSIAEDLLDRDPEMFVWWGTPVECSSALLRLVRDLMLSENSLRDAERRLTALRDSWNEIMPADTCRRMAERMTRIHPLRAADAFQLAAAVIASDNDPRNVQMVCFDTRLAAAARKEGFTVLDGLSR
ncbi:MAG: PIN domain-containing protein [Verrucomicrobia bacterium]|nr:PIN domain-containing protein [Verrucomicrobiota bacterium]